MKEAVDAVNGGMKIKPAALKYCVPRKTLSDYLRRGNTDKLRSGPLTVFTQQQERELVGRVKRLQQVGFPLTRDDIRRTAYNYAHHLNVSARFGKSGLASKLAGRDWFDAFMARNCDLAFRTTETLSYGRGAGLNRVIVKQFFDLLTKTIGDGNIQPQNIFNMDETGLQLCARSTNVIAEKGSKRIPQLTTGEKGETVTVMACCSATGSFMPPYILFKGIRRKNELKDGLPPGSEFLMTASGYANSEVFRSYIQFFCKHKPAGKTLLIMDGHRSHVDWEALSIAEAADIQILLLPAHTSHELQPLDKAVFKSLKSKFYAQCKTWHTSNPGRGLNKTTFSQVFTPAWNKSATRENAISGFSATGIQPLNPLAIADSAFAPADVSERPLDISGQLPGDVSVPIEMPAVNTGERLQNLPTQDVLVQVSAADTNERPIQNVSIQPTGDVSCELLLDVDESFDSDHLLACQFDNNDQPNEPIPCSSNAEAERATSTPMSEQRTPRKGSSSLINTDLQCQLPASDSSFADLLNTPKIKRTAVKRRSINKCAVLLQSDMVERNKVQAKQTSMNKVTKKVKLTTEKTKRQDKSKKQTCRKDKARKPPALPSKPSLKRNSKVACRGCGITENSEEDRAFGQDWIQCGCSLWWHEVCGENGGVLDDDYFTCPLCVEQQA